MTNSGAQANGSSGLPLAISADGRNVAFSSSASNFTGPTTWDPEPYVRNRVAGRTELVGPTRPGLFPDPESGLSISADGRYVAFVEGTQLDDQGQITNGHVVVKDLLTGITGPPVDVSSSGVLNDGAAAWPAISANGRYVAFTAYGSTLVPGGTNYVWQEFVHDRLSGHTEMVSVSSTGVRGNFDSLFGPAISADGRYVAFTSSAWNLVPGENKLIHVFMHDRLTGQTRQVDVSSRGAQANGDSDAFGEGLSISADGRYVAFTSEASNLVSGDTNATEDVFVHDQVTGRTDRVSVSSSGAQADGGDSDFNPALSADGRYVAFSTDAFNLVPGDTNGSFNVFVHDRVTGRTEEVSVSSSGAQGNGDSGFGLALSADGRYVAFDSFASNLVPGDTNNGSDVFVRDRGAQSGVCSTAAVATLDWHGAQTGSDWGYGFAAVASAGRQVCFGLSWSNNLGTPTGADLDLATTPGTPTVRLFTGTPGPHASGRTAWGCLTSDAIVAADIAKHPDRYRVTVRTAQYPAGAIAGPLRY